MTTVKPMSFLMNCGDFMCAKKTKITDERDDDQDAVEAILAHIARYRLSTFAVMSRLPQVADESPRRLRRLLRDCRDAGLLSSAALHSGSRYWFLTPAGATRCGLYESRSGAAVGNSQTSRVCTAVVLLFVRQTTASVDGQRTQSTVFRAASARNARHLLLRPDRQGINRSGTH